MVSIGFLGLARCTADKGASRQELFRYGPLEKDPKGYLDLPKGFRYEVISEVGQEMSDGFLVPHKADGMATFAADGNKVIIMRNHELSPGKLKYSAFGDDGQYLSNIAKSKFYDYGSGKDMGLGGVTTLVYNEESGKVENQFLSLAGTNRNCAGGPTPWGSWITCEEDVTPMRGDFEKYHGYNFDVPASTTAQVYDPVPLTAMGRFNHEAICVDPTSGIIYQTEDRTDSLFYRFIPNEPSKLSKGGRLQALCIRELNAADTRNWESRSLEIGEAKEVFWIDMDEVDSPQDNLREQGHEKGAAKFARGEGMWYGDGEMFFACTNGGPNQLGQIFKYVPSPYEGTEQEQSKPGLLSLFAESDDKNILKNCDNVTIAPWGDVILCEDHKDAYLRGITPEGQIYTLGHNVGSASEFAGACFSPSGKTFFVNIQGLGHTLAITGPWEDLSTLS